MKKTLLLSLLIISTSLTAALPDSFSKGPQLKEFGENAHVDSDLLISDEQVFKVVFDVGEGGQSDALNKRFNSLARFINMHVRAGVKPENIHLALVIHGTASTDVMNNKAYEKKFESNNPNLTLLNELMNNQVDIYLCGQSAAYYGVEKADLQSGVKMSLSAMTAHALLQQQAYTLNPF